MTLGIDDSSSRSHARPIKRLAEQFIFQASGLASLRVDWADSWGEAHDDVLTLLPEMPECSHNLFAQLARNRTIAAKRIAIVSRGKQPIAIVALRKHVSAWQPVTEGCVPWCLFPAEANVHAVVLARLGLNVEFLTKTDPNVLKPNSYSSIAIHRANLQENFEAFWRANGWYKSIRLARNRTSSLHTRIDAPGHLEWVHDQWIKMWKGDPEHQTLDAPDRTIAGRSLMGLGKFHVLTLEDAGEIVGGVTFYCDGDVLIPQVTSRLRNGGNESIGTRLFDEAFKWGASAGYRWMDLGGSHSYKKHWAPLDGHIYQASFRPAIASLTDKIRAKLLPFR